MEHDKMNMDLDNLKATWAQYDRKLDTVIRLNHRLLTLTNVKPMRFLLGWLQVSVIAEAVFALASVVFLGAFIAENIGTVRFALPAAVLDAFAIAFLINLIRQMAAAGGVGHALPIASIQKKLERVRILRIRSIQGLLVIAVLAWPLLCIVGFKMLFGLDAYHIFGSTWIWVNMLIGLAIIPLAIGLARKFGGRVSGSPRMQYIARTISGSSLNAANDFLAKLSAFESEQRDAPGSQKPI